MSCASSCDVSAQAATAATTRRVRNVFMGSFLGKGNRKIWADWLANVPGQGTAGLLPTCALGCRGYGPWRPPSGSRGDASAWPWSDGPEELFRAVDNAMGLARKCTLPGATASAASSREARPWPHTFFSETGAEKHHRRTRPPGPWSGVCCAPAPSRAFERRGTLPKRILIVEDNFDNREIYAEILRHSGYEILEAENGIRGVEKATQHLPDLILMDLSMPLMDGWEAITLLKRDARTAGIPVLAISAHVVMNGDYRRAQQAGFDSYITKPVEPKQVLEEIRRRIGPAENPA